MEIFGANFKSFYRALCPKPTYQSGMTMDLLLIAGAFACGGLIKGATGAGAPILAIPILALLYDTQTAVAIFVIPSLISNVWQAWKFREHRLDASLRWQFVITAAIGAGIGTVFLKFLNSDILGLMVASVVIAYISFRLFNNNWALSRKAGTIIATPIGLLTGILQGASGISAPLSMSYLGAMRIDRSEFISIISTSFAVMTMVQIPAMAHLGILTAERIQFGVLATLPLFAFMPVGAKLSELVSPGTFDKVIMVLLSLLALRLIMVAATGV